MFDVAADVANFRELCGLDLKEGRVGQFGQPARYFGFTDAGRANHQNVFGHDLFTQLLVELLAPPAVTQSDRDSALGVMLTDDMTVKFGNDLAWTELRHT